VSRAHVDRFDLLARHTPVLRCDSRERFTPVAVTAWTDRPGRELRRADGAVLARSHPVGPHSLLSLRFLGARTYADASSTDSGDHITATVQSDAPASPRAAPADDGWVYGHVAIGSDGRLWLSYWFFYLYNDYTLFGPLVGAGRHEGDWEMMQLRLDRAGQVPDLALYAQHQSVEARAWDEVERVGAQPVIYGARGCHACYYEPGWHWTGIWLDRADGRGAAPALTLEVLRDDDPSSDWIFWPGRWGATVPGTGLGKWLRLDSSSPRGPGHQRQWRDPANLLGWVKPRRRRQPRSARQTSG
jgi:hypothetical protein